MWCNNHKFHGKPIPYSFCTKYDFFGPLDLKNEEFAEVTTRLAKLVKSVYQRIDEEIMPGLKLLREDRFGRVRRKSKKDYDDVGFLAISTSFTGSGILNLRIYFFSDDQKYRAIFEDASVKLRESLKKSRPDSRGFKVRYKTYVDRVHGEHE